MADNHKLYDEKLVKEIMISTALCIHELVKDDPHVKEDEVYEFVEANFRHIISETLAVEMQTDEDESDPGTPRANDIGEGLRSGLFDD